jgi:hypothetical protein
VPFYQIVEAISQDIKNNIELKDPPEISAYVKVADSEMLKACLEEGTDFLNPEALNKF